MASFAKIGLNGKVIAVHSVVNEVLHDSNGIEREDIGIDFLTKLHGWSVWVQTSYNTHGGVHKLGGTPLRKNFAGINYTYDQQKDAFIPPKPYNSWILNEDNCGWEAPIIRPELTQEQKDNNQYYTWNEETQSWTLQTI